MIGRSRLSLITMGIWLSLYVSLPIADGHDNPFLPTETDDIGCLHLWRFFPLLV